MEQDESLERALADLEIVEAAYADEIQLNDSYTNKTFPLQFTLKLKDDNDKDSSDNEESIAALVTLALVAGYPMETGVQIVSYRSRSPGHKARLDETVACIRNTSQECLDEGMEGGLSCCATAFEVWNDYRDNHPTNNTIESADEADTIALSLQPAFHYNWITGDPLVDKKSTFQAHVCQVFSERQVKEALIQLIGSSTKIQKATHNMWAYRLKEVVDEEGNTVLKHDNDDDGEDAAGARLAHLLEMRKEDCVLVVVSRWFGGIKLGPKRFAHINNVARELLQECHDNHRLVHPQ